MPVDFEPNPEGNIVLENGVACVLAKGEVTDQPRYTSHFATCPQAKVHRRKS